MLVEFALAYSRCAVSSTYAVWSMIADEGGAAGEDGEFRNVLYPFSSARDSQGIVDCVWSWRDEFVIVCIAIVRITLRFAGCWVYGQRVYRQGEAGKGSAEGGIEYRAFVAEV